MQYINPYSLLGFNSENVSDANAKTIKAAKRKLLLEIELNDNETIECCGFSLTKSNCITIINELDDYDKNYFHAIIAKDSLLNDFLTNANIKYLQQYQSNPIYNLKEFVDFISPYFAFQYDKLLVGYYKTNNTKIVNLILSVKPISNDGYSEKCFKSTYAFLIKANAEIEKINTDIETNISSFIGQDFRGLSQTITEKVNISLLNILPTYFQSIRNKIAKTIFQLSATLNNEPHHSYRAAFQIIEVAHNILTDGLIFEKIVKSYGIIKSNFESIQVKSDDKESLKQKQSKKETTKRKEEKTNKEESEVQYDTYEDIETEINQGVNWGATPFWIVGSIVALLIIFLLGNLLSNIYFDEGKNKTKKRTEKYYFQKGNSFFDKKNYTDAILQYNKAINIDSSYADAYEYRGLSKAKLNEYEASIVDYMKAEENGLMTSTHYSNLGYSYYNLKQPVNALSNLKKAIVADSTNANAYRFIGDIEFEKKEYKKAQKEYSMAIKYSPTASNYFIRGLSFYNQGKYKEAIQDIDRSIEINPNVAQYYYDRGDAKNMISDFKGACSDWIKAKEKGYSVSENKLDRCIPSVVSMNNGNITGCGFRPKYATPSIDNFLRIKVGNTDVAVKLINIYNKKCYRYVFINHHTTYSLTNIPEGKYYVKIAYGKDWAKTSIEDKCQGRFTKNTLFEKGDEVMDFNLIENYNGWQVPSFELVLNVIISENNQNFNQFNSSNISENEFYNN